MPTPAGKKRVMLNLTACNYAHLQATLKALGIPRTAVSTIIDESIEQHLIPIFEQMLKAKMEGRQISFIDVLTHVDRSVAELKKEMSE
jgi:hypothetical protein